MTVWNSLTLQQFSDHWREFRLGLDTDQTLAITQLSEEFKTLPIQTGRTVDPYEPSSWPTPWEQIAERQFCYSGIGLFMFRTLELSPTPTDNLELWYVEYDGQDFLAPIFVNENGLVMFDIVCWQRVNLHEAGFDRVIQKFDMGVIPRIS